MYKAFTQKYKTHHMANGFSFTFYCDLCEKSFDTDEFLTDSFVQAFYEAQAISKPYFNKCHKCGKWICDEHYNENVMMCVECQPKGEALKNEKKENKYIMSPICKRCGSRVETENCFCTKCGNII